MKWFISCISIPFPCLIRVVLSLALSVVRAAPTLIAPAASSPGAGLAHPTRYVPKCKQPGQRNAIPCVWLRCLRRKLRGPPVDVASDLSLNNMSWRFALHGIQASIRLFGMIMMYNNKVAIVFKSTSSMSLRGVVSRASVLLYGADQSVQFWFWR